VASGEFDSENSSRSEPDARGAVGSYMWLPRIRLASAAAVAAAASSTVPV
jgi:hypothetical protein